MLLISSSWLVFWIDMDSGKKVYSSILSEDSGIAELCADIKYTYSKSWLVNWLKGNLKKENLNYPFI